MNLAEPSVVNPTDKLKSREFRAGQYVKWRCDRSEKMGSDVGKNTNTRAKFGSSTEGTPSTVQYSALLRNQASTFSLGRMSEIGDISFDQFFRI